MDITFRVDIYYEKNESKLFSNPYVSKLINSSLDNTFKVDKYYEKNESGLQT